MNNIFYFSIFLVAIFSVTIGADKVITTSAIHDGVCLNTEFIPEGVMCESAIGSCSLNDVCTGENYPVNANAKSEKSNTFQKIYQKARPFLQIGWIILSLSCLAFCSKEADFARNLTKSSVAIFFVIPAVLKYI